MLGHATLNPTAHVATQSRLPRAEVSLPQQTTASGLPATPAAEADRVSLSEASRRQAGLAAGDAVPATEGEHGDEAMARYAALGSRVSAPKEASGAYQRLLDRFYGGKEPSDFDVSAAQGMGNIQRFPTDFLTKADRLKLAEIYQYAEEQQVDIEYVDTLAWALGNYRELDDGKRLISFNDGGMYDGEGRPLTVAFTPEDAALASRIKDSAALGTTTLDQGFVRHLLDPGKSALGFGVDFSFLENIVQRFSASAGQTEPLNQVVGPYRVREVSERAVITAHEEGRLPPDEEPLFMNVNDRWVITERGKAAGLTIAQVMEGGPALEKIMRQDTLMLQAKKLAENAMGDAKEMMVKALLEGDVLSPSLGGSKAAMKELSSASRENITTYRSNGK
ncbi:MAG: hypothetical protein Q4D91_13190 [Lautropia sp.]|nr:hypothetical protein [Lautropia sp.]